ncbi:hypothetical protein F2P81_001143 [Scophthalmus maximus]|uniref:Uncharacterized protein n=1 Tax=Scophthalmus maximus TaxID=52904 RepID=A0A6A4TV24_SCOMX|nr:hypothetical protein F2P81_001143 [Scophthalmus maximus]
MQHIWTSTFAPQKARRNSTEGKSQHPSPKQLHPLKPEKHQPKDHNRTKPAPEQLQDSLQKTSQPKPPPTQPSKDRRQHRRGQLTIKSKTIQNRSPSVDSLIKETLEELDSLHPSTPPERATAPPKNSHKPKGTKGHTSTPPHHPNHQH